MTLLEPATEGRTAGRTGADRWDAAVRAGTRLLGRHPLHELTLDRVAAESGLPLEAVQEQVPDLNELLIAAIQQWNADRMAEVRTDAARYGTIAFLRNLLGLSIADPSCQRMVMTAASIAGSPDHASSVPLRQMWVRFHAIVQRALAHDVAVGREPDTMDPASGAEQLLAIYEGLQFQWLFRPHMDLLAAYDRATTRLRHGWSETYTPAVWDI